MKRFCVVMAIIALMCLGGIAQAGTTTLFLDNARKTADSVSVNQHVGGRSGVATLDSTINPMYANIWGKAASGNSSPSGFGMQTSSNQGSGDWALGYGSLLSDVTGVSFDWYRANGGLGGGFRLAMYVYGPAAGDESGFLQFDRSDLLADQTPATWNTTGNWLESSNVVNSAWYSADYGSQKFVGNKNWGEIQTALAGWSVYEIGIINDAGYVASVDNFKVTSASAVPEPATLLGFGIPMLMVGLGKLRQLRK